VAATRTSRRDVAPPVRSLDIAEIVRVARQLVASDGVDGLSMRALARELGVSPMATYHHVGNKQDLVALVIDDVLADVQVPPESEGDWAYRLKLLNRRSTQAIASCPGIERAIFTVRPTREGWRLIDAYIGILLDGGFSTRQATLGFSVLHAYGMGRAGTERELRRSTHRADPPANLGALAAVWPHWSELHTPDFRDFAFEVMIAGLRSILDAGEPS
jgi:AcrR family transcriptional regulator